MRKYLKLLEKRIFQIFKIKKIYSQNDSISFKVLPLFSPDEAYNLKKFVSISFHC